MGLLTIKQLDEWMTANCYNDSYAIGNRSINEGCGLDQFGSLYVWYYTERGERQNLNYFQTEQEAVEFAFKEITTDKNANKHLVGFLNVEFYKDEIPYGGFSVIRIRVFVFGCAIKKVLDLRDKYGYSP